MTMSKKKQAEIIEKAIRFNNGYSASAKVTGVNASNVKHLYSALVNYYIYLDNYDRLEENGNFSVSDNWLAGFTSMKKETVIKARQVLIDYKKIIFTTNNSQNFYAIPIEEE